MSANLTEAEFSKHLNTTFNLSVDGREIDLQLSQVKRYMPQEHERKGLERFSVFFDSPPDIRLPQRIYTLRHAAMGEFEIFLVPVSGNEKGFQYEAVFNYYK